MSSEFLDVLLSDLDAKFPERRLLFCILARAIRDATAPVVGRWESDACVSISDQRDAIRWLKNTSQQCWFENERLGWTCREICEFLGVSQAALLSKLFHH